MCVQAWSSWRVRFNGMEGQAMQQRENVARKIKDIGKGATIEMEHGECRVKHSENEVE